MTLGYKQLADIECAPHAQDDPPKFLGFKASTAETPQLHASPEPLPFLPAPDPAFTDSYRPISPEVGTDVNNLCTVFSFEALRERFPRPHSTSD
jgi:hypothetical protein